MTGASRGIGYELAKLAIEDGYDLIIAADDPAIDRAARELARGGGQVTPICVDLATPGGVERLYAAIRSAGRPVDALFANAGHGLGGEFANQDFNAVLHVINTNITGTIHLIQKVTRDMRAQGEGKILITGSIAGLMPGSYQAVYNGSKAFLDSFAIALKDELRDTGVTVTCLMPSATDTSFFERAGMTNTKVGRGEKDDPVFVAKTGYHAMKAEKGGVVPGVKNKVQAAMSRLMPDAMAAKQHREMAQPL